jgi:hypothetical protein
MRRVPEAASGLIRQRRDDRQQRVAATAANRAHRQNRCFFDKDSPMTDGNIVAFPRPSIIDIISSGVTSARPTKATLAMVDKLYPDKTQRERVEEILAAVNELMRLEAEAGRPAVPPPDWDPVWAKLLGEE